MLHENWSDLNKSMDEKEFTAGLQRMTNELKPKVEALHTEIGRVHKQQKAGKRD